MGTTSVGTVWTATRAWIEQPFSTTMNLGGWFLFVGMLGVILVAWRTVLDHLE